MILKVGRFYKYTTNGKSYILRCEKDRDYFVVCKILDIINDTPNSFWKIGDYVTIPEEYYWSLEEISKEEGLAYLI